MVRVDFFFKENIPFLEPAPKIDKTCDCPRLDLTIRLVQVNSLCFCWLPSASHGQQPTGEHGERISASLLFFFWFKPPLRPQHPKQVGDQSVRDAADDVATDGQFPFFISRVFRPRKKKTNATLRTPSSHDKRDPTPSLPRKRIKYVYQIQRVSYVLFGKGYHFHLKRVG